MEDLRYTSGVEHSPTSSTGPSGSVFLGRNVTIVQSGNDCAVREQELPFAVSLDRDIVAQNGSKTVKVAFFMGYGDQPPVEVSGGNFGYEDRRGFLGRGVSRRPRREGNNATPPSQMRMLPIALTTLPESEAGS